MEYERVVHELKGYINLLHECYEILKDDMNV
jgi:hypothetical protein